MKKSILLFLFLPSAILGQNLSINTSSVNDAEIKEQKGKVYDIETSGKDPYVFTDLLASDIVESNNRLAFEYFCPTGVDFIEIHFYPEKETLKPKLVSDVGSTEGWVEFKIDLTEEIKDWGMPTNWRMQG